MFFKPTFCSHCGVKIERIEWFPWTSRSFCEVCETEYKMQEWLPRILNIFIIAVGIFGFGSYLLSGGNVNPSNDAPQIKTLKNNNLPKNERAAIDPARNSAGGVQNTDNQSVAQNTASAETNLPKPDLGQVQTPTVKQTENVPVVIAKEPVYFCGAQTKKGTPCSRKVKGGGRCWQHEGLAAMLPPEKLLVNR